MQRLGHFLRRHLGAAIAATAATIILVGGVLTLTLAGANGASSAATGAPATTTAPAAAGAGRHGAKGHGVRGQITAIAGPTWTVSSTKGATVIVEVSASTAFGTKEAPLAATDFSVGDTVVVAGTKTASAVVATRIAKPPAATNPAPGTTTTGP